VLHDDGQDAYDRPVDTPRSTANERRLSAVGVAEPAVRLIALGLALAGAVELVRADSATLRDVRAVTATVGRVSAGSHHGHALLVVGVLAAAAAVWAALTRSRRAMSGVLLAGVAAAAVTLAVDRSNLASTAPFNQFYAHTAARTGSALGMEEVGSALLIGSGLLSLILSPRTGTPSRRRRKAVPVAHEA
jgi:hypothetical protein